MSNVVILSSTKGNNLKLSHQLIDVAKELSFECKLIELENYNLPLYTPSAEADGIPEDAKKITQEIINSKAIIALSPEYNGSIAPILINTIAWVSRSGSDDWRAAFNGKFAIVGTHSGGGGAKVCQAMRSQLEHLGCIVLPRQFVTNYSNPLKIDSAHEVLTQLKELIKG